MQINLFRMLAQAGTTGKRVLSLGNALLSQLKLSPKLRELAILQVAHENEMTLAFTSREIVELLLLIGYYTMLAHLMRVLEIEIDAPAGERLLAPFSSEDPKAG